MRKQAMDLMHEDILLEQVWTLSSTKSRKNEFVDFHLTKACSEIEIYFSYESEEPSPEKREILYKRAIACYGQEAFLDENETSLLPNFRNLITLSIDYEGKYLGAYHNGRTEQKIQIRGAQSSKGFLAQVPEAGKWTISMQYHCLESERIRVQLKVTARTWPNFCQYRPVEMHTHSMHSDGGYTVSELCEGIHAEGYYGLFLTDHNTVAGSDEIERESARASWIAETAIEWTTFHGHVLVYGNQGKADWRKTVDPNQLTCCLKEIRQAGGLIGIAHPYSLGYPYCTGCHFEFSFHDWEWVDFIELWNSDHVLEKVQSKKAYELWREKLDEGYRIGVTAGRDIHHGLEKQDEFGITYLGFRHPEERTESLYQVLHSKNQYISIEPKIDIWLSDERESLYFIGSEIPSGRYILHLKIASKDIRKMNIDKACVKEIILVHNQSEVRYQDKNETWHIPIDLEKGYLFVELHGTYEEKEEQRLLITSPFYII